MNQDNFDQLDLVLRGRKVPDAPAHLSARIIQAAEQNISARRPADIFKSWVKAFLDGFVLPQPAYALAAFLILGFVLGANLGSDEAVFSAQETATIYAGAEIDEGAWL